MVVRRVEQLHVREAPRRVGAAKDNEVRRHAEGGRRVAGARGRRDAGVDELRPEARVEVEDVKVVQHPRAVEAAEDVKPRTNRRDRV